MTHYGQTSKEVQEEYEKEEEPIEEGYMKTFPKRHSSILPHVKLGVTIPSSMGYMNTMDSIRMRIPHSSIHNKDWEKFESPLFLRKKRD
jgi:hypothetical protein